MMDLTQGWRCPQCGGELTQSGQYVLCGQHDKVAQVQGNLLVFGTQARPAQDLPPEEMAALCERAETAGWPAAMAELAERQPQVHEQATDRRQANWLYAYPGPAGGQALEVDAAWGVVSQALADLFGSVYALAGTPEQACLLAARFAASAGKVKVAAAVFPQAPVARASLALVVINGVLPGLAWERPERRPAQAHLACLRRAHGLLRPGGWLYLAGENRCGYPAGADGLRLLPRGLADRVCRRGGEAAGNRGRTYSYWGYRRLLRQAGFARLLSYLPLPRWQAPEAMVPLWRAEPLDHHLTAFASLSGKAAWVRRVPLAPVRLAAVRLLAAHFGIFAQKGEG